MGTTILRVASVAAMAITMVAAVVGMARAEDKRMERTITVSASGEIAAEPDLARIQSGVTTEAETARNALAANSAAMRKVIDGLKSRGIDPKDIQTSSFRVEPRYSERVKGNAPKIDGYRVHNQVHVALRDLGKVGEVLDELVALGANEIGGLSFEVSKAEELKDAARKEAVANALRRAKLLATAAGAEVGEVISITDEAMQFAPRGPMMTRAAAPGSVPIESGSQTLEARVTVTWALK